MTAAFAQTELARLFSRADADSQRLASASLPVPGSDANALASQQAQPD
jgi:hypothetical protein